MRPGLRRAPLAPEPLCFDSSVDVVRFPPNLFVTRIMESTMVEVTERHHPLVADFASERPRLSKSEMMCLAGHSPADEAWEGRHVFEVLAIPNALGSGNRERALIHRPNIYGLRAILSGKLGELCFEYAREHAREVHASSGDQIGPISLK
jgi:hypothetical protein